MFQDKGKYYPSSSRVGYSFPEGKEYTFFSENKTFFAVVSDVHLKENGFNDSILPYPPSFVKNVIVAGDIGDPFLSRTIQYMDHLKRRFNNVVVVLGNHEYYLPYSIYSIISEFEKLGAIVLGHKPVIVDRVELIGCCLWSNVPPEHENIIKPKGKINYRLWQYLHYEDEAYLRDALSVPKTIPRVVITHFPISYDYMSNFIRAMHQKEINYRYYNSLDELIPSADAFICGHTHHSVSLFKDDVLLCQNSIGYPRQNTGYNNEFFIEVSLETKEGPRVVTGEQRSWRRK